MKLMGVADAMIEAFHLYLKNDFMLAGQL